MKRIVAIGLSLFGVGFAYAAGTATGQVTYLVDGHVSGVELLYVRLNTESNASCATVDRFVIRASAPQFKTIAAMFLGAYLPGSSVSIDGVGTCTTSVGSEDISVVCFASGC